MKLTDVGCDGWQQGSHVEHGPHVEPATLNMATALVFAGVVVKGAMPTSAEIWRPERVPSSGKQDSIV